MLNFIQKPFALCIIIIFCLTFTTAYKFLGIIPTPARSHHSVVAALMKGLARKGHDVTVISPFPQQKPIKNYHDIPLPAMKTFMDRENSKLLEYIEHTVVKNFIDLHNAFMHVSRIVMEDAGVQTLMQSNQTFDAVICEVFLTETLFGFSEHFKAPLIAINTFGAHTWNTDIVGSPSPPSYVPSSMLPLTDRMTLTQRLANFAFVTFERAFLAFDYLPKQAAMYREYFPMNKRSMYDLRKNTALVLINQHVSLTSPRPYMPNQIEVGGMHINRQRSPLPADLQKFIDEAKHGVIYFSMGSNLKSADFPIEKRQLFLNTFRALKQRVLWKFEDANLAAKPYNVYISDWFPQNDILAHANVIAFITHGGLLSTTESIYHGKPFIGIPMFGDQFLNMARAESGGYGIQVNYRTLSAVNLNAAIKSITENPKYTQHVRDMSARYRDQQMEPLELAIYWVEHVVRHKGAEYMHCAGQDLNFVQYHSIDTLLILSGVVLSLLLLTFLLLRFIWHLLRSFMRVKKAQKQKKH